MKYFGVASCPYCKKRVNLLRTWSLKRQGEYQCPRCNGISNIFLSPLIYVFALLAVFSGGAVYFFHKFILDDVTLSTVGQVLLPFAVFFLLSLFMVHLEKPVIKKMTPAEIARKQRKERNQEQRKTGAPAQRPAPGQAKAPARQKSQQMFYDSEEYLPQKEYHTGTLPAPANQADLAKTAEVELPKAVSAQRAAPAPVRRAAPVQRSQSPAMQQGPQPYQGTPVQQSAVVQRPVAAQRAAPGQQAQASSVQYPAAQSSAAAGQAVRPSGQTAARTAAVSRPVEVSRPASSSGGTVSRTVSHVDVPSMGNDDFFAKYDDPNYVERRLQEIQQSGKK